MKHKNFLLIVSFMSVSPVYSMLTATKRSSQVFRFSLQKRNYKSVPRKIQIIYDAIVSLGSKKCSDACSMTHVVNNCSLHGCPRGSYPYSKSMAAANYAIKVKQTYLDTIDHRDTAHITEKRLVRLEEIKLEYEALRKLAREAIQVLQSPGEEQNWLLYKQLFMLVHHKAECLSDQVNIIKEYTSDSPEIIAIITGINKQHKAEETSLRESFPRYKLLSYLTLPGSGHAVPYHLQQQGKEYFKSVKE